MIEHDAAASRPASHRFDPHVIRFAGALDAATVRSALREIEGVVECGPRGVVVDLGDLEHLDSTGVRVLLTLARRVTSAGGQLVVVDAHDQPRVVLESLGLGALFGL